MWITPDMCHDGHDCLTAVADDWLSQIVTVIRDLSASHTDDRPGQELVAATELPEVAPPPFVSSE